MVGWLIGSSTKSRRVVVAAAAVVVAFGAWHLRDLKADALPEFGPPTVQIQTEAPGLAPAEVEGLVTLGLEHDLLNGIPWLAAIRSKSTLGLSSIDLIFEPGTDIIKARQVVQERLTQAHALPNVSSGPQMVQPLASTTRTLLVGLSSKTLTPLELGVLAHWTIRPRLAGIPGVASVAMWGQRDQQLQVQVDPKALAAKGVTLDEVIHTTGNSLAVSQLSFLEASTPGTGGFVDTSNQRLGVEHILPIARPDELAQVPLEDAKGTKLGDVATVVQDSQPQIGSAVGPMMMLAIDKLPGANTIEVTRAVEEAIRAMQPGLPAVTLDASLFRPARYVQTGIDNVALALAAGGVLLVLALIGLMADWRRALIAFAAIACSLATAVSVFYLRSVTVDAMVLLGLLVALVVVIDDAMDVEALARGVGGRPEGVGATDAIKSASSHLRSGLAYAGLMAVAIVLPVAFVRGGPGEAFLPPIVLTYLIVVAASTLVAMTVTPALSRVLLGDRGPYRESPLLRVLHAAHDKLLSATVRRVGIGLGIAAVLAAVGAAVVPGLTTATQPVLQDRDISVTADAAPGTSLPEMTRLTQRMTDELRSLPGVAGATGQVGRAVASDSSAGVDQAGVWVTIAPKAPYQATLASIEATVAGYPGLHTSVATYASNRTGEVLKGSTDPVVVRIFGTDDSTLMAAAGGVRNMLAGIKGVLNPRITPLVQEPTVQVEVNIAAAQKFGVKPGDVRREATALVQGIEVGSIFENQKVFGVVVKGNANARSSLSGIQNLLIDTPSGNHVRLGDVASVRITNTAKVITHDATKRSIDVTAGLKGRGLDATSADIKAALAGVPMPSEYHAELVADAAARRSNQLRVFEFGVAAAVLLFLLLQAAYRNWRLAALAYLVLPLSLVGAVVGAALNGGSITLGSIAGFLAVATIAGRGVILLLRHYRRLEGEQGVPFGADLVLRGTRERLGPTVMTLAATGLALLPIVVRGPVAGLEFVHPAAVVVLGGLVTTALLTMVILPGLYLRFGSASFAAPVAGEEPQRVIVLPEVAPVPREPAPTPNPREAAVADSTYIVRRPQGQS
jgi:Cu/Ag efflux pump CusA